VLTELSNRLGVNEQWLLSGDQPKLLPSQEDTSNMAVWDGMRFMIREQEKLPERIRWLREQHGLTLRQFARRLGYDPGHVSRIEAGTRPSRKFLEAIIDKLNVHRTWLEFGYGNPILEESQLNEAATRERVFAALKVFWSGVSKPDLARMLAEMMEHRHAFRVGWADAFQRILIELLQRDAPAPTLAKDDLFNALMILEQAGLLSDMLKVMKKQTVPTDASPQ
jgi:transcriptional regulator with XRE-family HTH domain